MSAAAIAAFQPTDFREASPTPRSRRLQRREKGSAPSSSETAPCSCRRTANQGPARSVIGLALLQRTEPRLSSPWLRGLPPTAGAAPYRSDEDRPRGLDASSRACVDAASSYSTELSTIESKEWRVARRNSTVPSSRASPRPSRRGNVEIQLESMSARKAARSEAESSPQPTGIRSVVTEAPQRRPS